MIFCESCGERGRYKIPAYWTDLQLCPLCCQMTAARYDRDGWPPTPWKEWPK